MKTLLTLVIITASSAALYAVWKPPKVQAQPKAIHHVEESPPPTLGRLPLNPSPRDKEASPSVPRTRGTTLDKGTTKASWYDTRPKACYGPGRNVVPPTELWVAHKTLPCGTLVEVSGPKGTLVLPVWDRGPYIEGRELDLSAKAFQVIVGPLSQGVGTVSWQVMG